VNAEALALRHSEQAQQVLPRPARRAELRPATSLWIEIATDPATDSTLRVRILTDLLPVPIPEAPRRFELSGAVGGEIDLDLSWLK